MTDKDPYHWSGELYEWLHEYEGYGLRSERLLDDIATGDPKRIIEWLKAAYEVGKEHAIQSLLDDGK